MSALTTFEISTPTGVCDSAESLAPIAPALAARSVVKRAMDLAGSIGGLILLSPLLVLIGLLVRLESRGPVLFRQPRMGLNGRVFTCLKFRTMVPDAEQRLRDLEARNESEGGVLFKIKDDPRVTPLGRFLRRTSLDELPQLWNVLVGEMSLVGPRPLQLRDSQKLAGLDFQLYTQRLSVVPGITGPWQVAGRSNLDSHRMVNLDIEYVTNWSMAADLQILFKTIAVVLGGKGAC
jgi:lipopolysaccharide/colanic/teichoic acid biosynthesis glycosyltransferase